MAKATKLEVSRRIELLKPLLIDGLSVHEIRTVVASKTGWGARLSEAQLKRYLRRARQEIAAGATFDHNYEFARAMCRNERVLARASTKGDQRTYLAANKAQCQLLQLVPPPAQTGREELSGPEDGPVEHELDLSRLTDEELDTLAQIRAKLDTE